MTQLNLATSPELEDLATVIRQAESEVVVLRDALTLIMLGEREDVTIALTARENLVARSGQLSGLRLAWGIVTGQKWAPEHPDLHVSSNG